MKVFNILVILAGGLGIRYGADTPKQYIKIGGKELLQYSIEEMRKAKNADKLLIVLNDDKEKIKRVQKDYNVEIVIGGKERAYSFQNALDYIRRNYPECKKVIFHEAARPLISHEIIDEYFKLLDDYDYVETCQKINDSLGSYIMQAPRREDYYLIQAPEAYKFSVLDQYYDCESDIYFAANQFPTFVKGYQYFGVNNNIKMTTIEDKILIEYLLSRNDI